MIPKKYAKVIVIIITILWCVGLIWVAQQEALIKTLDSFTVTGSTSTWVTE